MCRCCITRSLMDLNRPQSNSLTPVQFRFVSKSPCSVPSVHRSGVTSPPCEIILTTPGSPAEKASQRGRSTPVIGSMSGRERCRRGHSPSPPQSGEGCCCAMLVAARAMSVYLTLMGDGGRPAGPAGASGTRCQQRGGGGEGIPRSYRTGLGWPNVMDVRPSGAGFSAPTCRLSSLSC